MFRTGTCDGLKPAYPTLYTSAFCSTLPFASVPPATKTSPGMKRVAVNPVRPVAGAPVVVKVFGVPAGAVPLSVTVTVAVLGWPTTTEVGFKATVVALVRGFTVTVSAVDVLPVCVESPW